MSTTCLETNVESRGQNSFVSMNGAFISSVVLPFLKTTYGFDLSLVNWTLDTTNEKNQILIIHSLGLDRERIMTGYTCRVCKTQGQFFYLVAVYVNGTTNVIRLRVKCTVCNHSFPYSVNKDRPVKQKKYLLPGLRPFVPAAVPAVAAPPST